MSIARIDSNARMSEAVVYNGVVYLAGQVGEGPTVAAQTADALASIDDLLARTGSDKTRLLSVLILLADISTFDEMNSVYDKWIAGVGPPSRATCQALLAAPKYRVEIVATAAVAG